MAGKKVRPSVAAPTPGDEFGTFHMVFMRADYLRTIWLEAAKGARDNKELNPLTLEGGYGVPIWASVTLFLASLHTVIEGWQRLLYQAQDVDLLLK